MKSLIGEKFQLDKQTHEHYKARFPLHQQRQQSTEMLRKALRHYILERVRLADNIDERTIENLNIAAENVAVLYAVAIEDGLNDTGTEARLCRQVARERVRYG
jgi:predicted naringenin-chalcone synthase